MFCRLVPPDDDLQLALAVRNRELLGPGRQRDGTQLEQDVSTK